MCQACLESEADSLRADVRLLAKFAKHRLGCGCFICRNLTDADRERLAEIRADLEAGAYAE